MKRTTVSLLMTAVLGFAPTTDMSALIDRPKTPRGTECYPDFTPNKPQTRVCICRLTFFYAWWSGLESFNLCMADYIMPVDYLPSECVGPKENNIMCEQDDYTPEEGTTVDPTSYWVGNVPRFGIYPGRGRW